MNTENPFPFSGLSDAETAASRRKYGSNVLSSKPINPFWNALKSAVTGPMFILLAVTTAIYFIMGEFSDAWFMSGAIILVSAISVYQDNRSRRALNALEEFTQPASTVIRNNKLVYLSTTEIVVGDFGVVTEGELIPADGLVQQLNDFSVNESILTGESFAVTKELIDANLNKVFSGTLVESGQCVFKVIAIGDQTKLGQIGKSVREIKIEKSPLQKQVNTFVKWMTIVGAAFFLIIWGINFFQSGKFFDSLLKGLTIAMSVLPEEIPVALVTFMALGAWRLMRNGVIVKETGTVEALGVATVLCTDKTGTITENKMELFQVYDFVSDRILNKEEWKSGSAQKLISTAMWASEIVPFNPMETAIHKAYEANISADERNQFTMIHGYPLDGKPPMMTHVFQSKNGKKIIAVKGAPEAVLNHSSLDNKQRNSVISHLESFAHEGLRVLGVGTIEFEGDDFPKEQQEFQNTFLGLIAFYDPPKKNIKSVFSQLYEAGIKIKIITGDNLATTTAIARQAGFKGWEKAIDGSDLPSDATAFDKAVTDHEIFTRVFPDIKLKIIQSLKQQSKIVGMCGDGVNDGPAIKAAHIGIAMGKRGSAIAKEAASIILTDDDFGKMVGAVAMGRKIYSNLKKSIQYIISIHIPIILTVAIPLVFGWIYPTIFTPVHVIFLELIMGPTCSIVYENEPLEKNAMLQKPRLITNTFFNLKELTISIFQGLAITAGTLFIYQMSVQKGYNEELTRSLVFSTLIFANLFLTLANRSFYFSTLDTLQNKNVLLSIIIAATLSLLALILYIPSFSSFFKITSLNAMQASWAIATGFVSVGWFEFYKWRKRKLKINE
jgi:P-type Ca2+ transporter type 2C